MTASIWLRRATFVDQFAADGEMVVMLPDLRVMALSRVGTALMQSLPSDGLMPFDELVTGLARDSDLQPVPDDLARVVGTLVATLEEDGLLVVLSDGDRLG